MTRLRLFDEQVARKPDLYPWANEYIRTIWHGFWTPDHFNFRSDVESFRNELTEDERHLVAKTIAAIAQVEVSVKTFWGKLGDNLRHPSIRDLGYAMANSEVIHNLAYEKLLVVLHMQDYFQNALLTPELSGRVKYLRKYLEPFSSDHKRQYIYSLILFTLFVENVSLFSQFYILLWFNRRRNVLKDTAQQIQYTRNEEMLHARVGTHIISVLREEYPELFDDKLHTRIYEEAREAYKYECNIAKWILGDFEELDLSVPVLSAFIAQRLNRSLSDIGLEPIIPVDRVDLEVTKWFDEELLGYNMTDFFHKIPTDYAKHCRSWDEGELFS